MRLVRVKIGLINLNVIHTKLAGRKTFSNTCYKRILVLRNRLWLMKKKTKTIIDVCTAFGMIQYRKAFTTVFLEGNMNRGIKEPEPPRKWE